MKAYKGFNKDMTCRGFQFEEGETYHEETAELCKSGFHACEDPLNVFDYYSPVDSKYHEVELDEVSEERESDSKVVAKKITIGAEIGIPGLVKAHIERIKQTFEMDNDPGSSGYAAQIGSSGDDAQIGSSGDSAQIGSSGRYAQIGSSGYAAKIGSSGRYAQIGSSGRYAQIGSSGDAAKIGSSGDDAQIGSSGYAAQIGSSGDDAQIGSSGDSAQIGSSGYAAKIGSSGRYAKIGSSGDDAKIECSADHAVICCAGKRARIKAPVGTWITLAEYGEFDGDGFPCKCVKSALVDGKNIKADTWYTLKDGEFVEVNGE